MGTNPAAPQPNTPAVPALAPAETCKCRPDLTPWWKSCIEIGAILVGVWVAIIYSKQLCQMIESNKLNREAIQSVQRAFVTFSPSAGVGTFVKDKKVISWSPQIPITNNGATPTKGMLDRANVLISQQQMPGNFDFHDTGEPSTNVLGPKEANSYETDPIPIDDIRKVQLQTGHVYIYGWAAYNDVFPQTKRHTVQFCYELHVNTIAGDLTDPKYQLPGRFTLCRVHNCTDDDCAVEKKSGN